MDKVTFVISDESVNSYGKVILTDGIDISQFERNPVMLYMHERATVVGRWENIRKEEKKLLADAVFDDSTPLGAQVKNQVEKGFLRSASGNFNIIEEKTIDGVDTITKSELFEVSIVDIPGNNNALRLYRKNGRNVLRLVSTEKVEDLRVSIIDLLGLDKDVTDNEILAEIQSLLNAPDEADAQVNEAIKNGFIESASRAEFLTMARLTPKAFKSFLDGEERKRKKALSLAVDEAFNIRRVPYHLKGFYERIAQKIGTEDFAKLIAITPKPLKLSQLIRGKNRDGWTLADYRIYAPEELKNNPKLYQHLLDQENEAVQNGKSLEYYRKNNPEYLKEHPEVYQKLVNEI